MGCTIHIPFNHKVAFVLKISQDTSRVSGVDFPNSSLALVEHGHIVLQALLMNGNTILLNLERNSDQKGVSALMRRKLVNVARFSNDQNAPSTSTHPTNCKIENSQKQLRAFTG